MVWEVFFFGLSYIIDVARFLSVIIEPQIEKKIPVAVADLLWTSQT